MATNELAGFVLPGAVHRYLATAEDVCGSEAHTPFIPTGYPIPFASWVVFALVGNGDELGCYWPEGSSKESPIILSSSHDVYGVIPEAGSFEGLLRRRWLTLYWEQGGNNRAEMDAIEAVTEPPQPMVRPTDPLGTLQTLYELDRDSPYLATALADRWVGQGNLTAAETLYRHTLQIFPSYTAARYGLALLLRRTRCVDQAIIELVRVLVSPSQLDGRSL